MKCYKLFHAETIGLEFTLSQNSDEPANVTPGRKTDIFMGTTYTPDWHFTEETKRELQHMYVLINPKLMELPDLWGSFLRVTFKDRNGGPMMISPALHEMLNNLIPGEFETVPAGPIIDRTHDREITDHGHVFATFLDERDTYDREKTRIKPFTRGDGRTFLEAPNLPTIDARVAQGGVIWREAVNGELFVSERFKHAFEVIGGKGVRFHPLPMSHL